MVGRPAKFAQSHYVGDGLKGFTWRDKMVGTGIGTKLDIGIKSLHQCLLG